MTRLILSLGSIMVAVALVASGTVAFFSDTESSTNNVFAAGALDLLIDNDSYYNGNRCTDVNDDPEIEEWQWVGDADYPVPGTPCSTSFVLSNLDDGLLFFNFLDVKPDDEGEDTISLTVQNDAWICMDLTLTADDDNSSTEPELDVDVEDDPQDPFDGELASGINFFWWADDGDNVYEADENPITNGVVSLAELDQTFPVALADSQNNVWGEDGPVPANEPAHIAKAWCLGDLTPDPVPAGEGENPSVDPGVNCDGSLYGNEYQTDSASLDISFSAVQARNNDEYLCEAPTLGSLTVIKEVSGGDAVPSDFTFTVNGPSGEFTGVVSGDTLSDLIPGDYTVVEEGGGPAGYTASFAQCGDGTVSVTGGNNTECTVTNVADLATVTIDKSVSFTSDIITISISNFELFIDDGVNPPIQLTDQVSNNAIPAGTYTVSENYVGGQPISWDAQFSGDCTDDGQTGTLIVPPGGNVTCNLNNSITVNPN